MRRQPRVSPDPASGAGATWWPWLGPALRTWGHCLRESPVPGWLSVTRRPGTLAACWGPSAFGLPAQSCCPRARCSQPEGEGPCSQGPGWGPVSLIPRLQEATAKGPVSGGEGVGSVPGGREGQPTGQSCLCRSALRDSEICCQWLRLRPALGPGGAPVEAGRRAPMKGRGRICSPHLPHRGP